MQPEDGAPVFGAGIKFYADWGGDALYRTGLHLQHSVSKNGRQTIDIELARIVQAGQSPDWKNKISLQLTGSELVDVTAALLGVRKSAFGAYHGAGKNKGFQVHSNPAKGALFAVSAKGEQLRHLVGQADRAAAAAFFLSRLAGIWGLDAATALRILERIESSPEPEQSA